MQPVNADEGKVNKLNQKLSHIVQFIKNEIEKTKDYQINTWKEVKHKNFKNVEIIQHKLTGFFSDFPFTPRAHSYRLHLLGKGLGL